MTTTQPEAQPQDGSALTTWNTHIRALVAAPEQAHAAMQIIHDSLIPLYNAFIEKGNKTRAEAVKQAYEMATGLYEQGQSYAAALAAGEIVISEVGGQRQQAVTELAQLMKAINEGDEFHPKLSGYAQGIRDEVEEWAADVASDNLTETVEEWIAEE